MRIIRGNLKGKRITVPSNFPSRPTTDFAKEGLFNILENLLVFEELDVLDLCTGTGNIAFEFISRGAGSVMAVDSNLISFNHIRKLISMYKISDKMQAYKADCILFCRNSNRKFDLVFADPPYHLKIHSQLLREIFDGTLLNAEGKVIMEHNSHTDLSTFKEFSFSRKFGNVYFSFFNFNI
ncbi:MAG: methyltransferase [Bacteroidetes bacterium]|nr:methyltransferase [Bacteroidota bacterium]